MKGVADPPPERRRRLIDRATAVVRREQFLIFLSALLVGLVAGYAALGFRLALAAIQWLGYGYGGDSLASFAADLPWWRILLIPTLGGVAVTLILRFVVPSRRPEGVAEVIEAAALHGNRMSLRQGFGAALVSVTTLGSGGSAGREGPVVHLCAALASAAAQRFRIGRSGALTLLGCGVASGVAASFNAPIAGVIFAHEVVIGHYALRAFAPVVISAVAGTIVTRIHIGDFPAFQLQGHEITSFLEMPAFALLGLISGIVAVIFARSVAATEDALDRTKVPDLTRPVLGGLAVGAIAILFPQVLGVGYEATNIALGQGYGLRLLVLLIIAKTAATAITLGCRLGGGVFSPSLYLGAMTGGAFGIVAGTLFPDLASDHGVYATAGMGALAAAVLGAPISTVLIVFELTSDYQVTLAVMVAVVVATMVMTQVQHRSFFHSQLARRGIDFAAASEAQILVEHRVRELARNDQEIVPAAAGLEDLRRLVQGSNAAAFYVTDGDGRLIGVLGPRPLTSHLLDPEPRAATAADLARPADLVVTPDQTLAGILARMAARQLDHVPVVEDLDTRKPVGILHRADVLAAYNRALVATRAEEHGEA